MGIVSKVVAYTLAAGVGFGACYVTQVDHKYEVVESAKHAYVIHKDTGLRHELNPNNFEDPNKKCFGDRIEEAFKVLVGDDKRNKE